MALGGALLYEYHQTVDEIDKCEQRIEDEYGEDVNATDSCYPGSYGILSFGGLTLAIPGAVLFAWSFRLQEQATEEWRIYGRCRRRMEETEYEAGVSIRF
jgi:hypothetical protein